MTETLVVPARFNGPPTSGNGGWVCGALASFLDGPAEVTLLRPPPLERPLAVEQDGPGVRLLDAQPGPDAGEAGADADADAAEAAPVVASAVPIELGAVPWPDPVSAAQAAAAEAAWSGHGHHAFATCFSCGPARAEGDGLRLFTGPVEGREGVVAARWAPHVSMGGADGLVDERIVWAALDCPSGWPHLQGGTVVAVLGRMAAEVLEPVPVGAEHVVVGAATDVDGRKRHSVSALFDGEGRMVAHARATWIVLDQR